MPALRPFLPAVFLTACLSSAALAQWPTQPQQGWGSAPSQSPPPQQGWGSAPATAAPEIDGDPVSRLNRLEEQLRGLNGKIEQLQFENRSLQDQLKRAQEDAEFRFQELEGGKKGAPRLQQRAQGSRMPGQSTANAPVPVEPEVKAADEESEIINSSPQQLGAPPKPLGQLPTDAAGNPVDLSPPGAVSRALEPLPGAIQEGPRPGFTPSSRQSAAAAPSNDPKDQFDLAYGYMLRGDYEMAEVSFKDFLDDYPKDANAATAAYWLGESQYQRKQYKAAAESFLKVYSDHPTATKAPESLLRLGMSLKALGQKDAACATLAEVARKYPKASPAVKKRVQTEQRNAGC